MPGLLAGRLSLLTLVPLSIALVAARVAGALLFPTYDDAFITFRYARNLVHGHGFVYNPGEWVLGVTAPLFAVVPALLEALGLPVPLGMIVVNIACDLAVLYVMYRILETRAPSLVFVWFGVLYAASPILVRISVGGMEADLFLLASLLAMRLALDDRPGGALVLAAAATWLRPEGLILVGLVSLMLLRAGPGLLRSATLAAGTLIIPAAAMVWAYGSVVPNSVATKAGWHSSVSVVLGQLVWPDRFVMVLLPLAAWGGWRLWQRHRGLRLLMVWGLAYLAAYLVRTPMVWSWYAAPAQCTLMLMSAVGIVDLMARAPRGLLSADPLRWATAGGILVCTLWAVIVGTHDHLRRNSLYAEMRAWAEANDVGAASVLAMDIGAIGYFSGAYVFDGAGLVWKDWNRYRSVKQMIVENEPQYVMLNAIRNHVAVMTDPELQAAYALSVRLPARSGPLETSPDRYPAAWRQEYLIFKRKAR
jgi:hypothetical protein